MYASMEILEKETLVMKHPLLSTVLFFIIGLGPKHALATENAAETALIPAHSAIERVYIDRSSSYDPGTLVIVLKNTAKERVQIGKITVNGVTVKDWPSPADPVLWHRMTRPTLMTGETGLVLLKLAQQTSGMVRLAVDLNGNEQTVLLSASGSEPVRVSAIRYDMEGKLINLFVRNSGKTAERLNSIECNSKTIWTASDNGLAIEPDAVEVAHIMPDEPLKAGSEVQFRLVLSDRVVAVRDRAIPGFRISVETGDQEMARRIHADPLVLDSFQFLQEPPATAPSHEAPSLVEQQGARWSLVHSPHGGSVTSQKSDLACVFACPTHTTDSYHTSAYLAMMAQHEVEKVPCWQSFIHVCRSQPLQGLAMFGQLADCVQFNAQLQTSVSSSDPDRDEVPWTVYQFVRYAVESAAPSKALSMVPVERDRSLFTRRAPLAIEARQMVYSALAAGSGGLAYRIEEKDWGKENRDTLVDEVTCVNDEVRQLRDYLALGFPRSIASTADAKIQVACIDAMPKGLVLILINHDIVRSAPELPPSVQAQEHTNVAVEVNLPKGFVLSDVNEVHDKTCKKLTNVKIEGGRLHLVAPSVRATEAIVITPVKKTS